MFVDDPTCGVFFPEWCVPKSFVPEELILALKGREFFVTDSADPITWDHEDRAFWTKLFTDDRMDSIYKHLKLHDLTNDEWCDLTNEIFNAYFTSIEGRCADLSPISDNPNRTVADSEIEDRQARKAYYQDVASAAYKLFGLLGDEQDCIGELVNESGLCDSEGDIRLQLMKIVGASTSAYWPLSYVKDLERNDEQGVPSIKTEELMKDEMPWTLDGRITKNRVFHDVIDNVQVNESAARTAAPQFISEFLASLDSTSISSRRLSDGARLGSSNELAPSSGSRIFLNPAHWIALCGVLFNETVSRDSLKSLISTHKRNSARYEVKDPGFRWSPVLPSIHS